MRQRQPLRGRAGSERGLVGPAGPAGPRGPQGDAGSVSRHGSTHKYQQNDAFASDVPAPRAVPFADAAGSLDQWITWNRLLVEHSPRLPATSVVAASTVLVGTAVFSANNIAGANPQLLYLDPAAFAIAGKTTKLRLSSSLWVTDTAPGVNFTLGLYPVTAIAGGTTVVNLTLGAVVAGSTILFTTPAANSKPPPSSVDFTFPAAGDYILGCAVSAAMAANSNVIFPLSLRAVNV